MKHLYLPILLGLIAFAGTNINAAEAATTDESTQQVPAGAPLVPGEPAIDTATAGAGAAPVAADESTNTASAAPARAPLKGPVSEAAKGAWSWISDTAGSAWDATTGAIGNAAAWVHEKAMGRPVQAAAPAPAADASTTGGIETTAPAPASTTDASAAK